MVCVDGFILTHAYDRVDIPTQAQVDAYLPPFEPVQVLDCDEPVSIGAMVGPEAFFEVRYLQHHKQQQALDLIPALAAEFKVQFGRDSGGLIRCYRCDDAETIVVALGSVNGTIKDAVDERRKGGQRIGSVSICSFRPFPLAEVRAALQGAQRVVVIEKSLAVGIGGMVSEGVRKALSGINLKGYTVIAGLGGRPITLNSLTRLFAQAERDELKQLNFLDLNWDVVNRELERSRQQRRAGPSAENILRDLAQSGPRLKQEQTQP
jgi:pyruvate ferredoxin oxidoreductase alpha subunit